MAVIDENTRNFLQSLTNKVIDNWTLFEELLTSKKIKKNEHFFQHFEPCEDVAIVNSGLFRLYLVNREGEEKTYSFIPEKSFILDFFLTNAEEGPRKAMISAQALEDSEIYTIKYSKLIEALNSDAIFQEIYRAALLRNYLLKTKDKNHEHSICISRTRKSVCGNGQRII